MPAAPGDAGHGECSSIGLVDHAGCASWAPKAILPSAAGSDHDLHDGTALGRRSARSTAGRKPARYQAQRAGPGPEGRRKSRRSTRGRRFDFAAFADFTEDGALDADLVVEPPSKRAKAGPSVGALALAEAMYGPEGPDGDGDSLKVGGGTLDVADAGLLAPEERAAVAAGRADSLRHSTVASYKYGLFKLQWFCQEGYQSTACQRWATVELGRQLQGPLELDLATPAGVATAARALMWAKANFPGYYAAVRKPATRRCVAHWN